MNICSSRFQLTRVCMSCTVTARARLGSAPTSRTTPGFASVVSNGGGCPALKAHRSKGLATGASRRANSLIVRASFFGVGAPEAVLVGVVALVLFGPKGLAQAAKSLGQTLRAFAPTLRELTQVSTELKSTIEEEIGLNDFREELQRPAVPQPRPAMPVVDNVKEVPEPASETSLSELTTGMKQVDEAMAAAVDPEIGRKRDEAARMAWGGQTPAAEPPAKMDLTGMSVEELEAELARRKAT